MKTHTQQLSVNTQHDYSHSVSTQVGHPAGQPGKHGPQSSAQCCMSQHTCQANPHAVLAAIAGSKIDGQSRRPYKMPSGFHPLSQATCSIFVPKQALSESLQPPSSAPYISSTVRNTYPHHGKCRVLHHPTAAPAAAGCRTALQLPWSACLPAVPLQQQQPAAQP